ncbi:MAG: sigma-54 dependent transcriptional regulator [Pseudomonadota bacterium]
MPIAKVLVVEDDKNLREALCDTLDIAGFDPVPATDGKAAIRTLAETPVSLIVSDVQMQPMNGIDMLRQVKTSNPGIPTIMMTAYADVPNAVTAMQIGAVDYLVKPFSAEILIEKIARHLSGVDTDQDFVAVDPATQRVLKMADRVAPSDATVMITGNSGTGKEVFAQYIHQNSKRKDGPFVAINCAAIPADMLEATLFGYKKGAFTGATSSQMGKFEQAQGGTLLLDEVSEMDLGLQAKLLRVLQEREVERLGDRTAIQLDVRVLATTNRDLLETVKANDFREDLYYRLNVFPLHVPDLRDRPGDILPLAKHFLERFGQGVTPTLTAGAEQSLLAHPWTGNVRELENLIQRSMILSNGTTIDRGDLGLLHNPATIPIEPNLEDVVKTHERERILDVLNANNGNRQKTAEALGISPRTLRYKLAKFRNQGHSLPNDPRSH